MTATTTPRATGATPDPRALRHYLDGEHREIRELTRETLTQAEFARPSEISRHEYRDTVLRWMRALAQAGGTGLGFPREYGGGGNVGGAVAAFETVAHHDLSLLVKVGVQFGLFGGAVLHVGTREHHERYLPDIISAELPGCFAMTETGHGSDVQSLGTTATYDPEQQEFVIHTPDESSRKDYIGNAAQHGRMAAVFAQLVVGGESHGIHALLVPIRDEKGRPMPGVRLEDCGAKLGLNGVDNGRLWFDHVRVPRTALLNRYADVSPEGLYTSSIENPTRRFFTMLGTLIQGRVCVGGAAISASKSALTIAIRYALERRQFGPPDSSSEVLLLDYRIHQRRLLPLLAKTYALHFAQEKLVAQLHQAFTDPDYPEHDRRELEAFAAGLKAVATWHATTTIQACREACGGAGYLSENQFAALKADTDVFTTFEGDNTILLQLVVKGLLTDYRDQFGELAPLGLVRFVAGQVLETAVERSRARHLLGALVEAVPGVDDPRDFPDREFHGELLRWREEHILASVARRLRGGIDQGFDPFEVFTTCQDHAVAAARAHVERVVHDAFADAVERCPDPSLQALLGRACDLYGLATIEQEKAFLLEHGRMSSLRSKAVTRAVNQLCVDLRPHARVLVDGFGIPDALLAAPIATGDGA
jgi:acyl-CoA oxidase